MGGGFLLTEKMDYIMIAPFADIALEEDGKVTTAPTAVQRWMVIGMDDLFDIEDKFRKVQKERCDGCKYCKVVHANGGFSFYGCHHKPYRGKWVAEIKDCPKATRERENDGK